MPQTTGDTAACASGVTAAGLELAGGRRLRKDEKDSAKSAALPCFAASAKRAACTKLWQRYMTAHTKLLLPLCMPPAFLHHHFEACLFLFSSTWPEEMKRRGHVWTEECRL